MTTTTPPPLQPSEVIARFEEDQAAAEFWYQLGYATGYAAGYQDGHAAAETDMDRHWRDLAAAAGARGAPTEPPEWHRARTRTAADVDAARWSVTGQPRTRATFAEPVPGDHPGGLPTPADSYGCAHDWPWQRFGEVCRVCGDVIGGGQ